MFKLSRVKLYRKCSEGNENCFELAGGSSYRGFELSRVDCTGVLVRFKNAVGSRLPPFHYTLLLPLSSLVSRWKVRSNSAMEKSAEQRGTECSNKRD